MSGAMSLLTLLPMLSAAIPSLNPATYKEPEMSSYFGKRPPEFSANKMTREEFDNLAISGRSFVIRGFGAHAGPIGNWTCEDFANDKIFSRAKMSRSYTDPSVAGAKDVKIGSKWWDIKIASVGEQVAESPTLSPFYWGIKDVQYSDSHYNGLGWKEEMLTRVQALTALPHFMNPKCRRDQMVTPEFWFNGPAGSGARAHIDSHIQATTALQLSGTRRWRIMLLPKRNLPHVGMLFDDGKVYEDGRTDWQPTHIIDLAPGDALVFGPGVIHETKNVGGTCAVAMTFQFNQPMASRLYRQFLPRFRRTADLHESWPLIRDWAFLNRRNQKIHKKAGEGLLADEAREYAKTLFRSADLDGDGRIAPPELDEDAINFNDIDEDGSVSLEEYQEVFQLWAATELQVKQDTPRKFWRLHYDQDALEDANFGKMSKMIADHRATTLVLEDKMRHKSEL